MVDGRELLPGGGGGGGCAAAGGASGPCSADDGELGADPFGAWPHM